MADGMYKIHPMQQNLFLSSLSEIKVAYSTKVPSKDMHKIGSSKDAETVLRLLWSPNLELREEFNLLLLNISKLSKIDPIFAYRLRGKNKIIQSFDLLQDYRNKVQQVFPGELTIDSQLDRIFGELKPEIIREALIDLEDDINRITWAIGIWTWYKSKILIRKSQRNTLEKEKKELESFIDKHLNGDVLQKL